MRKLWVCLFYALCVFTIAFSLFWMALPKLPLTLPAPAEETPVGSANLPSTAAQAQAETLSLPYYLCDEGGRVAVYRCNADGTPEQRILLTGIYVNLLPEGIKSQNHPPQGRWFRGLLRFIRIRRPSHPAEQDRSCSTARS